MALDTSLNGIRASIVTSMWGRREGLDQNDFICGPKDTRLQVEGVTSGGSTLTSTSALTLSNFGFSLVGASGASATTGYVLGNPTPGVYKTIFVPTTGYAVIQTSSSLGSGAFVASTGSVTSTHQTITLSGKGTNIQLFGVTTALWGALTQQYSSVSTNISIT